MHLFIHSIGMESRCKTLFRTTFISTLLTHIDSRRNGQATTIRRNGQATIIGRNGQAITIGRKIYDDVDKLDVI